MAFGTSRMACVPNCASPPLDVIIRELGNLEFIENNSQGIPDIFSLSLKPVSKEGPGGKLTLGTSTCGGHLYRKVGLTARKRIALPSTLQSWKIHTMLWVW